MTQTEDLNLEEEKKSNSSQKAYFINKEPVAVSDKSYLPFTLLVETSCFGEKYKLMLYSLDGIYI